jgi:hypothetical protein
MPENVITTGAGNAGAVNTGNNGNVGNAGDKGGGPLQSLALAGQATTSASQTTIQADDGRMTTYLETGGADDAAYAEFGDESFDDDVDAGQKKDVPFKDLLEQLKSQDPAVVKAAEKQMKRDFFENRRYKQIPGMESPEKARELVDKLETFGGVEGIEQSRSENVATWEMLANGDPALLDKLEKTHAEGISKLAPHVLERFEKLDPNGWAHSMAEVFMATMSQAPAGGISALAAINAFIVHFLRWPSHPNLREWPKSSIQWPTLLRKHQKRLQVATTSSSSASRRSRRKKTLSTSAKCPRKWRRC